MNSLGEKIKKRRKDMKLTLKQLAGTDFSYSLLSQIENDKANPSMETLHKLAKKLEIPISDLLNPVVTIDYKSLLSTCEKNLFRYYDRDPQIDQEIIKSIEEVLDHLTYSHYEEVRLIEIYCMCSYYVTEEIHIEFFEKVLHYYQQTGALNQFFKTKLFIINANFSVKNYDECSNQIDYLLGRIEKEEYLIEKPVILRCYYTKSLIAGAKGNYLEAMDFIERCFDLAESTSLYSQHSAYLQYAVMLTIQLDDNLKARKYIEKFRNYVQFTENMYETAHFQYSYYHVENRFNADAQLAAEINDFIIEFPKTTDCTLSPIYNHELAYAHWKNRNYQLVIDALKDYEVPSYINHPLDRAACIEALAIRAYCLDKLGNREKGVELIVQQYQLLNDYPDSTYKNSVTKIYRELLNIK
ncbi:hypothetical protein DCE79_06785 [Lysinibacillus sp. 2017]|uniref:helix-turn-helix domain-containing protein n=1 Tax=unclassified Lysinibacillus TaxID=2636778 RepID=UPI000D527883|nr:MULTISPECIES: helix-turn-helix transcriptional regulator [unclassified Lysinibacillus]AWE07129.1 hypothetical protein DCE79_06785 [Lysinibacillus sp. 2017]TGN36951.1 XRE family transcriptional regulator [Lysinibacillus sp. S2017]